MQHSPNQFIEPMSHRRRELQRARDVQTVIEGINHPDGLKEPIVGFVALSTEIQKAAPEEAAQ